MAKGFRATGPVSRRRYAAGLSAPERAAIADLLDQVRAIVEPQGAAAAADTEDPFAAIVAGLGPVGRTSAPTTPDTAAALDRDPALDRIVPAGNTTDEHLAAEFRRLTEHGLRSRKARALEQSAALLRRGGPVSLTAAEAAALATALTDTRLVAADRLGIVDEGDVDRLEAEIAESSEPERHPLVHLYALYDFLTWLQETLTTALLTDVPPGGRA